MLDPEFKERWLHALRSGEIKQTNGALCRDDGMCCLGVAAFIADPFSWENKLGINFFVGRNSYLLGRQSDVYFSSSTLGLSNRNAGTLANMNDNGRSFAEIADYIEKHY